MNLLRWDGWLLHYNTDYLRKHTPSVPCSVLLSNNYVIIKPCRRNIKDSTNLAYSENVNIEVPVRLSFPKPFLAPWQKKVHKIYLLCNGTLLYPSSLNFCYSEFNYVTRAHYAFSLLNQSL